jgi:hypothetical protein
LCDGHDQRPLQFEITMQILHVKRVTNRKDTECSMDCRSADGRAERRPRRLGLFDLGRGRVATRY